MMQPVITVRLSADVDALGQYHLYVVERRGNRLRDTLIGTRAELEEIAAGMVAAGRWRRGPDVATPERAARAVYMHEAMT